jgi:hypothetical protein
MTIMERADASHKARLDRERFEHIMTIAKTVTLSAIAETDALLSPKQKLAVLTIAEWAIKDQSHGHPEDYEFKEFRIEKLDWHSSILVHYEIGGKGDEGSWASIMCRDRRMIRVGVKGGKELISRDHGIGKGGYKHWKMFAAGVTGRRVTWK